MPSDNEDEKEMEARFERETATAEEWVDVVVDVVGELEDLLDDGDGYDAAIDLLTDVLEFKCEKHGELAIECAPAFYNYGLALFGKARLENDVFGEPVQKAMVEKVTLRHTKLARFAPPRSPWAGRKAKPIRNSVDVFSSFVISDTQSRPHARTPVSHFCCSGF